jgi:protein-S-isoprenylcysteine O-methyltransferase Ste14
MMHVYRLLFPIMWISWALCWWVQSINVKVTIRRESLISRLVYILPLMLAVLLIWAPNVPSPLLHERFLPETSWIFWLGSALTAGGLLFSVWARLHLGRNWSGTVTIKEDHEFITCGPYAFVRHPIYSGLLLAFIGSAAACGQLRGLLSVVLVYCSLWYKLRQEERWMREQFGEAYQLYCRRVAALVPFIL